MGSRASASRPSWPRRIGLVLALLVVLIILLPLLIGSLMSREHIGSGEAVIDAPIAAVWESVSGFDDLGEWAPDVANMTRVADVDGLPSYEMRGGNSTITFTFAEVSPPKKLVVRLRDDSESYGGVWTYELASVDSGTRVTITEQGWTEPVYFRFMLWAFGYDRTIETYLASLREKHAAL